MTADPSEMRAQAQVLRREAAVIDDAAVTLRGAVDPHAMVAPAADRLWDRLSQRAASLGSAAQDAVEMAALLEREAAIIESQAACGG